MLQKKKYLTVIISFFFVKVEVRGKVLIIKPEHGLPLLYPFNPPTNWTTFFFFFFLSVSINKRSSECKVA